MTHQGERSIVVQDGFSIVEALFAAALIGLAFLAISTLFPTGYSNTSFCATSYCFDLLPKPGTWRSVESTYDLALASKA